VRWHRFILGELVLRCGILPRTLFLKRRGRQRTPFEKEKNTSGLALTGAEKLIFFRLLKNGQMQGARNSEE
jgi:hypothetical protein